MLFETAARAGADRPRPWLATTRAGHPANKGLQYPPVLARRGNGGKRRGVEMDRWGKRRDKPAWRRR